MERVPVVPVGALPAMRAYDRETLEAHIQALCEERDWLRERLRDAEARAAGAQDQLDALVPLGDQLGEIVVERQHLIARRREANRSEVDRILDEARRDAAAIRGQAEEDAAALRAASTEILHKIEAPGSEDKVIDLSSRAVAVRAEAG